jgi:hypothetical protein
MPLHSLSMENIPFSADYSSNSVSCPSFSRLCPSNASLVEDKSLRSQPITVNQSCKATQILSPFLSEPFTPRAQLSQAEDAFPFPLQPEDLKCTKSYSDSSLSCLHLTKKRRTSGGSAYPTPPSSPLISDRYIPARRPDDGHLKSFHVGKSPDQLSPTERLLRHKSATPDPFRARNPQQLVDLPGTSFEAITTNSSAQRNGGLNGLLRLPSGVTRLTHRQVSTGAVWNVGGGIPSNTSGSVTGVPNGRGGLLGSGTNAPMFSSGFFEKETSEQSKERFEGRVAAALDIDRANRTLSTCRTPEGQDSARSCSEQKRKLATHTSWRDAQWMNDNDCSSKLHYRMTLSLLGTLSSLLA